MATTGQLTVGEVSFAVDDVQTDVAAWTVITAGNMLEIISVTASTPNVGLALHTFDVRDTGGQKLVENLPLVSPAPLQLGPYPPGERPRLNGLIIDTPVFTTGPVSYTVVFRNL